MEGNNNTNPTFFMELARIAKKEYKDERIRTPSIANTYQNEPEFQKVENISRNYAREGHQKFADPFAYNQRLLNWDYDGRNLHILNTLKSNATRSYPTLTTPYPLRVVGFY